LAWLVGVVLVYAASPAYAVPGTCTIETASAIVTAPAVGTFEFPAPAAGIVLGTDIDPATGSFTLERSGIADIDFDTAGGPATLRISGPTTVGRIDAGGNVFLPDFDMAFIFARIDLPTRPILSTAVQSKEASGVRIASAGAALDFATGLVTLDGPDVMPNAPVLEQPVISGLHMTCRLAPVPDPATLPAAAQVRVTAKAKIGSGDADDELRLRAKVTSPLSFAVSAADLVIRMQSDAGSDHFVAVVPAAAFQPRGRKFAAATVSVGTEVGENGEFATVEGSATVVAKERGGSVSLRAAGLDLSGLTGNVRATVVALPNVAVASGAVRGSGRKRKLKLR
jgi:hypothetical protein